MQDNLKANRHIVEMISKTVEENPTWRFNQLLHNLGITHVMEEVQFDFCNYNESSVGTVGRVLQARKKIEEAQNE